jgi:hypothetical protein
MTEEQIALARRAVACKGWKWMPGMRARGCGDSGVVTNVWCDTDTHQTTDIFVSYDEECRSCEHAAPDYDQCLPDLTDPATLGCLLALVRELRQEPTGFVVPTHAGGWSYYTRLIAADWYAGDTEAEALLAALESAP